MSVKKEVEMRERGPDVLNAGRWNTLLKAVEHAKSHFFSPAPINFLSLKMKLLLQSQPFCQRKLVDKSRRLFGASKNTSHLCNPKRKHPRGISSAGSEHLPYKQRVGGSNPSSPTLQKAPQSQG
jgi:hypothetical protein